MKAIVITRDRVTYAKQTCHALARMGLDVHIVDHGSSWPPMLDWLYYVEYPVLRCGDASPRDLWGRLRTVTLETIVPVGERYVVSDPDLVPSLGCADGSWLALAHAVLNEYSSIVKCGPGLRIDDLPFNVFTDQVKEWERQFWIREIRPGVFSAPIDTTCALYRPWNTQEFTLGPGARLGDPYTFRHLPWYELELTQEIVWYRAHALEGASHWEPQR